MTTVTFFCPPLPSLLTALQVLISPNLSHFLSLSLSLSLSLNFFFLWKYLKGFIVIMKDFKSRASGSSPPPSYALTAGASSSLVLFYLYIIIFIWVFFFFFFFLGFDFDSCFVERLGLCMYVYMFFDELGCWVIFYF